MIVINFKNYLSRRDMLKRIASIKKYIPNSYVCISPLYLNELSKEKSLKVYSQNVDWIDSGKSTGKYGIKSLKEIGLNGALINHSENRKGFNEIANLIKEGNKLNFKLIVCVDSLNLLRKILSLKYKPFAIAYEDPKLISGKKSIIKDSPKKLSIYSKLVTSKNIKFLCGAGINSREDVIKAHSLGCDGVLIASAIVNSSNYLNFLKEIKNLNKF